MTRSLTLLDSALVDRRTVDKLLQTVVFFADSVAIRASFEIAPSAHERAPHLVRRIEELHEAGLLRLWCHEYETDDAGRVTAPSPFGQVVRRADLVVPRDRLGRSLAEMDTVLRSIREEAYRRQVGGREALRQGTAEIVGLRSHLASLVVSAELDQDGLLTNPAARDHLVRHVRTPSNERFETAVVADVVARLGLGALDQLTLDQIIEARRYHADFRRLLDKSLLAVARGVDPVITPAATAKELAERYRATVAEFARPDSGAGLAQDVVWDLLGAAVPSTMLFKHGVQALRWRRAVDRARPFLLLMYLERALHGRRG